ncbi:MAG: DNA methyltransferase [Candidatus Woesearchaeota archaeon]
MYNSLNSSKKQSSLDVLKEYLKEMFQFSQNELDFGIYKIYKLKKNEISRFIDEKLEVIVKEILVNVKDEQLKNTYLDKENKIKELELQEEEFSKNRDYSNAGKIREKITKLEEDIQKSKSQEIVENLENEIYNYILNFFELYYSNGDFGYNSRSQAPYKVDYDYNGEDVNFHWKHKGSYYIKTGNGFNSIKVDDSKHNVKYEIILESIENNEENEVVENNNNKDINAKFYLLNRIEDGKIIFNLCDSASNTDKIEVIKTILKELYGKELDDIYFYDKNNKAYFNSLEKDNLKIENGNIKGYSKLKPSKKKDNLKEEIEKRLKNDFNDDDFELVFSIDRYINQFYIGNDSDYFIHKDLKGFLTNEKEKFIKNHILSSLQELLEVSSNNKVLIIIRAFNTIVNELIEFLSAIEEFQKSIFERKKKVITNEYCITIDYLNEELYDEILENTAQLKEFEDLYGVQITSIEDLKNQPTLVIDTKHFSQEFKEKVLESFDDIEESLNGVLINSENFQALNLMQTKYKEKIQTIYIDPPFNTGRDFLYKDNFRNSSWCSFMNDRIKIAKNFLNQSGGFFLHLDDKANYYGRILMNNNFGEDNYVNELIWCYRFYEHNVSNWNKKHDTIFFYSKSNSSKFYWERIKIELEENSKKKFKHIDENGRRYTIRGKNLKNSHLKQKANLSLDDEIKYPDLTYRQYLDETIGVKPRDYFLIDILAQGNPEMIKFQTQKPENLIKYLTEPTSDENDYILDFFMGSGTTISTSIKLNRKFIGVEMGNYFSDFPLKRMKSVLFGKLSGISKETGYKGGGFFKYQLLEQYEDILDNIEEYEEKHLEELPLKYLYRREELLLNDTIDLSKPFENTIKLKSSIQTIDLVETYFYIKGYFLKQFKKFTINNKTYKCYLTKHNVLVIFRNIEYKESDIEELKQLLEREEFKEIEYIEVNHEIVRNETDFDELKQLILQDRKISVKLITKDDFNE